VICLLDPPVGLPRRGAVAQSFCFVVLFNSVPLFELKVSGFVSFPLPAADCLSVLLTCRGLSEGNPGCPNLALTCQTEGLDHGGGDYRLRGLAGGRRNLERPARLNMQGIWVAFRGREPLWSVRVPHVAPVPLSGIPRAAFQDGIR
jgi:hypothetical protein